MLNQLPRCPRSSYPNFINKKFDYSRDSNLVAYYNAADRLRIEVLKFGHDTIDAKNAEEIIDKIISTDSIHEMTVYADILWDAYNSYHTLLDLLPKKITTAGKKDRQKLILLIQYLQMHRGLNRRPINGKHFKEIDEDAKYYREIAEKSNALINELS